MFSFFRQKQQNEVRDCIQRILNRSRPKRQAVPDLRLEPRYSRSVAIILIPWDDEPLVDHAAYALVQNLSDRGARIIAQKPILVERLLCCFALDGVRFLSGTVRQAAALGGGFWQCGITFNEAIALGDHPILERLQPLWEGLAAARAEHEEPALST
jgi:hypothetical protein